MANNGVTNNADVSLQTKVFRGYSLLLGFAILAGLGMVFLYLSQSLRQREIDRAAGAVTAISDQLDLHAREMDRLTVHVIADSVLVDQLITIDRISESVRAATHLGLRESIVARLFAIAHPFEDVHRVSVITNGGTVLSSGMIDQQFEKARLFAGNIDYLSRTMEKDGAVFFRPTHSDRWAASRENALISAVRLIKTGTQRVGFVEVQKTARVISAIVDRVSSSTSETLIIDDRGAVLYPYPGTDRLFAESTIGMETMFEALLDAASREKAGEFFHFRDHDTMWFARASRYTDWIVAQAVPTKALYQPVIRVQGLLVTIGAFAIALFGVASYWIAAATHRSLRLLHNRVVSLDFHSLSTGTDQRVETEQTGNTADRETRAINDAFSDLAIRLKRSFDESVALKSQYLRAHYEALQAQTRPHFLTNALARISIIAKRREEPVISGMCLSLSQMIGYAADAERKLVPLREEVAYAQAYLRLVGDGYEHRLSYHFDTDNQDLSCHVPKMIIQPIVENSVTHGMRSDIETITISVTVRTNRDSWSVVTSDNGRGIPAQELSRLRHQLRDARELETAGTFGEHLTLHGAGILSTYERLLFWYGRETILSISSKADGDSGTMVTLSAPTSRQREWMNA